MLSQRGEKKARGDARALIGELKDILYYLDMVAEDGVELAAVVNKLSIAEYKRLSKEGYNFNALRACNPTAVRARSVRRITRQESRRSS